MGSHSIYFPLAYFTQYNDFEFIYGVGTYQVCSFIFLSTHSTIQIYHILLIHSSVDRHLDCSQLGDIIKKIDMHVHV